MKKLRNITQQSFKKYGYVLEHNSEKEGEFQVVLNEHDPVGWRMAASRITAKTTSKLAKHPNTMESFVPVCGVSAICVAASENPEDYEVFLLDKGVCLYKNTWHSLLALSEVSMVTICENLTVEADEYLFSHEISVCLL